MRAQVIGCTLVFGLLVSVAGCGKKGGLGDKVAKANEERKETANKEIDAVVDRYLKHLLDILPPAGTKPVPGQPPLMLKWRKQAAAKEDLAALCRERATELKDAGAEDVFQDCALLFDAIDNYWLGREVKGPAKKQEWEEGYQASLKVAAKEGAREMVPLNQHVKNMKELGREEGAPWRIVADFELLLPHLMQVYQFRSYKGVIQATSFSRVWQVMFDLPRTRDAMGPESYQPYRDRLCKTKLGDRCKVPYESRDIAVRRAYLEAVIEAVASFRKKYEALEALHKKYADRGFGPILEYFTADLENEKNAAVVPEEYPVLPSTRSPVWSSPYTVLVIGPKGATLETDDPADKNKRKVFEILEARDSWALDEETATTLVDKVVDRIVGLREEGAGPDYTTQVYYHFDKDVPARLFGTMSRAYQGAGLKLVDFVARRRFDGTLRVRRVPGNIMDEEVRTAILATHPKKGAWGCLPVASLADSNLIPDMIQHYVFASKDGVVGGAKGKSEVSAALDGDLSAIGKWVTDTDKPTLIAVHGDLTNDDMHKVLSAVSFRCKDEACEKPDLVSKLALGICETGAPPPPPKEK